MPQNEAMTWKVLCWTRFRAEPDEVWAVVTDPAEVASLFPAWIRWEVSDPEGLRAALRGAAPRVFATRFRALGRTRGLPLQVSFVEPNLRCALVSSPPWVERFELRMRVERAMSRSGTPRVRLVHELIIAPVGPLPRLVVMAATRMLRHLHARLAARLGADQGAIGDYRVVALPAAMVGHADDPLGLSTPLDPRSDQRPLSDQS